MPAPQREGIKSFLIGLIIQLSSNEVRLRGSLEKAHVWRDTIQQFFFFCPADCRPRSRKISPTSSVSILVWFRHALRSVRVTLIQRGCKLFCSSLAQILKQDWPHNWPNFITDLVTASKTNEVLCTNNMHILQLLRCGCVCSFATLLVLGR